jgi:predicted AlkP superfamily pyrophosphatase or phosphodiesterase
MKKIFLILPALFFISLNAIAMGGWPANPPKLVVMIVIDQFRADYLSRFDAKFGKDGFKALMKQGAYFPYGEYDILHSMTAPGHATVLTGAYPYQMGIPLNDWFDQKQNKSIYCVEDAEFGRSPQNLVGTTLGDEMKNADLKTRVVSLALKDRAAILMGGHRADLALWYDDQARQWTSSDYYLKKAALPPWVKKINSDKTFDKCELDTACGIELTTKAFETAVKDLKLGQTPGVDLIAVSFSSHDYAGHRYGPNAPEMETMTLAEDKAIARIRKIISSVVQGGLSNTTFVLTGDHGIAPTLDYLAATGIEAGTIVEADLTKKMETIIKQDCGSAKASDKDVPWIQAVIDFNFYINEKAALDSKCGLTKIEEIIKKELLADPRFVQAYTQDDIESRKLPPGQFGRQADKTFYRGRSGHVTGIQKPFYTNASKHHANHMTGYTYDRTVPLLFSGHGIQPGLYADKAEVIDIAPTLAFLVGVVPPALSEGKVLKSALRK